MLKIKDNVDLKELEKFGFNLDKEYFDEQGQLKYYYNGSGLYLFENEKGGFERIFDNTDFGYSEYDVDTLYDLIKADLVEKIDD